MKVKKPNSVIYFVVYVLFFPVMKLLFRLEVDRRGYDPPEGAFIAVSNHSSFVDFLIVMLSLYPHKVNAVAAQKFFLYKPLHKLLPFMGCIPKNLFDPDVRSIIGIKNVLKNGGQILLFPEGRCASDGAYAGMHKSTGKLIKKLGVPVVSCSVDGAYTCMPFWRGGLRTGRVRIILANLFSSEDLQSLSVDEINSAVDRRLNRDEDPVPRKPFRTTHARRLAEGLQYILYWCPKCGKEFTTETEGCVIRCIACGNAALLDRSAVLNPIAESIMPRSVHEWYKEQARYEAQKLHVEMEPVRLRVNVRLPSDVSGGGMVESGSGMLSLSPDGWRYEGELKEEQVSLFFPIDTVPAIPFGPNDNFQIYAHGTFYMLSPEDKRDCVKYSVIGECAYWKFAKNVQMTPCAIFNEQLFDTYDANESMEKKS